MPVHKHKAFNCGCHACAHAWPCWHQFAIAVGHLAFFSHFIFPLSLFLSGAYLGGVRAPCLIVRVEGQLNHRPAGFHPTFPRIAGAGSVSTCCLIVVLVVPQQHIQSIEQDYNRAIAFSSCRCSVIAPNWRSARYVTQAQVSSTLCASLPLSSVASCNHTACHSGIVSTYQYPHAAVPVASVLAGADTHSARTLPYDLLCTCYRALIWGRGGGDEAPWPDPMPNSPGAFGVNPQ